MRSPLVSLAPNASAQKQKLPLCQTCLCIESDQIDTGRDVATKCISPIPFGLVRSCRHGGIDEISHELTRQVIDRQTDGTSRRKTKRNDRAAVEWIWVVWLKNNIQRQRAEGGQCLQRLASMLGIELIDESQ